MLVPIYLDYAATTPVDPLVAEQMIPWLTEFFGNPSSNSHAYGWNAEEAVENARLQIANVVGATARDIIFTSGATESNNLAIKGAAQFYSGRGKGKHIVTLTTEHKAVLDTCRELERQGFEVTYLDVDPNGIVDLTLFEEALRPDTVIASVMHVNNEIGVIQNIEAIGQICRKYDVVFHVDAAQSAGKLPINLQSLPVDLMSFSAHKVYGPKGIGALYVRRKPAIRLQAQIHGGGHERGLRSGTLATHQIVGMGAAFELAAQRMETDTKNIKALHTRLWQGLTKIRHIHLNGDPIQRVPHNLNVSFAYIDGEALMMALPNLAVSSGSACTSASIDPSHVLQAIGCERELALSSLRISIGRFTTASQIDTAIKSITEQVNRLRELSPLWEAQQDGINLNLVQWTN